MAIQVSYLEEKLYPSWFKRSGPPSQVGEWHKVSHGSVPSFRGN